MNQKEILDLGRKESSRIWIEPRMYQTHIKPPNTLFRASFRKADVDKQVNNKFQRTMDLVGSTYEQFSEKRVLRSSY